MSEPAITPVSPVVEKDVLLEISDLTAYYGSARALDGVTFSMAQ